MKRMNKALLAVALAVLVGSPAMADDEQIAKQIIERLQHQKQAAQLDGFNIGVQVEDGTVTMMGTVAQTDHALMALDVARRVPGVKLVVNDLFVQPGGSQAAQPAPNPVIQASATEEAPAKSLSISAPATQPIAGLQTVSAPPVPAATPQISGAAAGFVPPTPQAPTAIGSGTMPQVAAAPQPATARPAATPQAIARSNQPLAFAPAMSTQNRPVSYNAAPEYRQASPAQYATSVGMSGAPVPIASNGAASTASYDNPQMPGYAWPSYAAYPNYAALTYPHQYSPTAWPYIGPFYPYPQVPLGWRKVTLEWDDGWWFLDFKSK